MVMTLFAKCTQINVEHSLAAKCWRSFSSRKKKCQK